MADMTRLRELSDAATPGPWIRAWASLDVHHMGGKDALQARADIDFAVAACAYVRDLIAGEADSEPRPACHYDCDVCRALDELERAYSEPVPDDALRAALDATRSLLRGIESDARYRANAIDALLITTNKPEPS